MLKFGKTALHFAAEKGFEQIVKILVEHGSNLDLQTTVLIFFSFFFFFFFFFFLIFILSFVFFSFSLFDVVGSFFLFVSY